MSRGGYCPTPSEARRWRSLRAKKGWKTRRRRGYVAKGRAVPHERYREHALALAYRVRQVKRSEFARRFAELRSSQGILVSERGLETRWQAYCALMALYRRKGQDFRTTNGQCATSLCARGRPRGPRTVRRAHRDIAAMGLLHRLHVRRGGAQRGNRDCLRVRLLASFVPPPSAAEAAGLRPSAASALNGLIRPPDGGGERAPPAAPAGNCGDEEVRPDAPVDGPTASLSEPLPDTLEGLQEALRKGFPGRIRRVRGDDR